MLNLFGHGANADGKLCSTGTLTDKLYRLDLNSMLP